MEYADRFPKLLPSLITNEKNETIMKESIINYQELWTRLSSYLKSIGRVSARPVLLLYYVMKSKDTPLKDKVTIFGTLAYIVLPIDILDAKRLPIIGWFDEIASISVAYQKVCKHITPEMEAKVDTILDSWFLDYTEFEEVKA